MATETAPVVNDENPKQSSKLQKEFVDDPDTAKKKISEFVKLLKASKNTVVFTGAGISTNTKRLADFRGDNGLISNRPPLVQMGIAETKMDSIMPTFTHVCIQILTKKGFIRKIVTSNHDGLHNKSNVASEDIADLFGNVFVEKCRKCKTWYTRKSVVSHLYRKCDKNPKCKGKLKRTACNMNESVNKKQLQRAENIAEESTLSLVLGSSMTIWPFCDLPTQSKGGYVLVTRQETSYDEEALLCVHLNVDEFMLGVVKGLNLEDECKEFVYLQVFDWNAMVMSNDLILFGLNSKESNEGLPFIQSARVQIIKENQDDDNDEKEKSDDCYDVIKEYELQKMRDLNWKFEIMKSNLFDALSQAKDCQIRIEIEWESGFEMEKYTKIFDGLGDKLQSLPETMHSIELELRKFVKYDISD